ncbi:rhomboid family intramembrane serine protease [Arcanobacterium wilhelmae]|uniref:rhomboid family intramembrane serine protease n=1 Tax=Arcanobacterium wilhelmae TaxID=1803177 RepID=UPI002414E5C8|nr:rhomboid family intramembrane serine protease [Arcanobacterium wilhelmae]WFN90307.1 rhomboid family intramembrane serine protease [Arcanobacterium wilhelmae]
MSDSFDAAPRSGERHFHLDVPPVTGALAAACVVLAGVDFLVPSIGYELLFYPPLAHLQPYRYVTSAFLHAGFVHLLFNMYALVLMGRMLEPLLGKVRFGVLYLLSALAGNVAVAVWVGTYGNPDVITVGASGAVFGLFGAYAVLARGFGAKDSGILGLIAINLVLGFVIPGISWESHVGGLVIGALLAWLWLVARRRSASATRVWHVAIGVGVFAALVGLAAVF